MCWRKPSGPHPPTNKRSSDGRCYTKDRLVFAGKGMPETVFQQAAGAHNNRILAVIFQLAHKLLSDAVRNTPTEDRGQTGAIVEISGIVRYGDALFP